MTSGPSPDPEAGRAGLMRCPYCAEDIRSEAIVCRHCGRDLMFFRPVLDALRAATDRISALERRVEEQAAAPARPVAEDVPAPTAAIAAPQPAVASAGASLPTLDLAAALAIAFLSLVAIHFVVVIEFDMALIWLRVASLAVPATFGFLARARGRNVLLASFGAGIVLAVLSILAMSLVVAKIDRVPVLPQDAAGWREAADYGASIAFSFLTGALLRQAIQALRQPSAGRTKAIELLSAYIARKLKLEKGKGMSVETIEAIVAYGFGLVTAIISIVTGLGKILK